MSRTREYRGEFISPRGYISLTLAVGIRHAFLPSKKRRGEVQETEVYV